MLPGPRAAIFPHQQILRIHAAAIELGLGRNRDALLVGLHESFVASLTVIAEPAAQLLEDLGAMNRSDQLNDGTVPLEIWLENACALAARGGEVFQRALSELLAVYGREAEARMPKVPRRATGPRPSPTYPDEETRLLGERLEAAYARRRDLERLGGSLVEVDEEILALRRQLRSGGQLKPGDRLGEGRYLLLERMGRGGFGVVWKAHDEQQGERVAVKVLHGELGGDPVQRARFFRGARAMAAIAHPSVVRVLDQQREDSGFHYFVMELVPGGDLQHAVIEGRMPRDRVIPVILGVGGALAVAHGKGMVHRDVKPANILLDAAGAPKLSDFDLVGERGSTGGTRTGAMGTFLYAAPELMKNAKEADARADVYALGMTAIFGLSGAELPMDVLRDPKSVIDALALGDAVKAVLRRAVAWDKQARYTDAGAFCVDLERAASGAAVTAAASAEVKAAQRLSPGVVLSGRYEIVRWLWDEDGSDVYGAKQVFTEGRVVVKVVREASRRKAAAMERFRRGMKAAALASSDYVIRVSDFVEDPDHGTLIVSDLLEGERLIDRLKRTGPMTLEELHPLVEQLWIGLHEIHRAGVVHRDIKLSSVFLERRPGGATRVKIQNFDIAKLPKGMGETPTEIGQSLGTFIYMSPEQIGKARLVDARADIYAGTTLIYQSLSGQIPYPARNVVVMVEMKTKNDPRTLADAMGHAVDPSLEAFIARGLARNPAARFQSALEALEAWRALRPAPAPR